MRNIVLLLAVLGTITLFAQHRQVVPAGEYLISGRLTHVADGAAFALYQPVGNLLHQVGVDTLRGGTFSFRDTVSMPRIVQLACLEPGFPNYLLEIWVAPGKQTTVVGHDRLIGTWELRSEIPKQIEENRYHAVVKEELCALMLHEVAAQGAEAAQRDSMHQIRMAKHTQIAAKTLHFMQTAPVTPLWIDKLCGFAVYLQYGYYQDCWAVMNALYDRLTAEQQQTEKGRLIHTYLYPDQTVGVGDDMVDGDLYDLEGNLRRLAEFRGRYMLLDFWSQGCGPCVQSLSEMEQVAEQYKDNVTVVSICQDTEPLWKAYVTKRKLTGNQWNELTPGGSRLGARYRLSGVPHYVLIGPDGKIIDVWSGYGEGILVHKLSANIK